jgi:hypothetical protein
VADMCLRRICEVRFPSMLRPGAGLDSDAETPCCLTNFLFVDDTQHVGTDQADFLNGTNTSNFEASA